MSFYPSYTHRCVFLKITKQFLAVHFRLYLIIFEYIFIHRLGDGTVSKSRFMPKFSL